MKSRYIFKICKKYSDRQDIQHLNRKLSKQHDDQFLFSIIHMYFENGRSGKILSKTCLVLKDWVQYGIPRSGVKSHLLLKCFEN